MMFRSSLRLLCNSMRRQIISRAFYGWLAHCRHLASVRTYLTGLVNKEVASPHHPTEATAGVTDEVWKNLFRNGKLHDYAELARHVYFGGVRAKHLRPLVWLYLLGYYEPETSEEERRKVDNESKLHYARIRMVDHEIKLRYENKMSTSNDVTSTSFNGVFSSTPNQEYTPKSFYFKHQNSTISDVFASDSDHPMDEERSVGDTSFEQTDEKIKRLLQKTPVTQDGHDFKRSFSHQEFHSGSIASSNTSCRPLRRSTSLDEILDPLERDGIFSYSGQEKLARSFNDISYVAAPPGDSDVVSLPDANEQPKSCSTMQPESSDLISVNLTQIAKDVFRCDRNHEYFTKDENLRKLSNIMSCYVWEHPEAGYVQGMCDLAAPLLVLFDDESLVYSCFVKLMEKISFQKGNSMDIRLANLRSLIQVLDYELYEHLHKASDSTHFFFCYRWFLLEFKREMAEKHDGSLLTSLTRKLVADVQKLIQK